MGYVIEHKIVGLLRCFQKVEALVLFGVIGALWEDHCWLLFLFPKMWKGNKRFCFMLELLQLSRYRLYCCQREQRVCREHRLPHSSKRLVGMLLHVMKMLHKDHPQAETACFYKHHLPSIHRCFHGDSALHIITTQTRVLKKEGCPQSWLLFGAPKPHKAPLFCWMNIEKASPVGSPCHASNTWSLWHRSG